MIVFSEFCVCEVMHASEENSELGAPEHLISIFLRVLQFLALMHALHAFWHWMNDAPTAVMQQSHLVQA
jgi:hypothetical protein